MATQVAVTPLDRRPSLTSTTSDDSPSSGDVEATTPPELPVQLPVIISRCNSATGEQEEPEVIATVKPAFVLPPPQAETRGRADGKRKIGTLSMSRSMGSLRPKSKDAIDRRLADPSPAPSTSSTVSSSRPKPVKTNSFSAFFRKLVGGGSSSSKSARTIPVPTPAPAPAPVLPRSTPASKPSLAIDTIMTPRSGSPVAVETPTATAQPTEVDPCEVPLPPSPTPYNIALPASPALSVRSLPGTAPVQASDSEEEEEDDDVASLSGMGSEESAPIVTPATPMLIHRSPPSPQSPPPEFGGKVTRSPSRWRNSVISTSLPLRKPSRSAGPPPSSYDAYEAQQRRQASHRRSCQPTMHTRATLAAETRQVSASQDEEEMMERMFMA